MEHIQLRCELILDQIVRCFPRFDSQISNCKFLNTTVDQPLLKKHLLWQSFIKKNLDIYENFVEIICTCILVTTLSIAVVMVISQYPYIYPSS